MTKLRPRLMDVTRGLSNRARTADFNFGEDTAIVAVQHMLWQTRDLFEALSSLGAKRANIFCPYAIGFNAKESQQKVLLRSASAHQRWLRSKR